MIGGINAHSECKSSCGKESASGWFVADTSVAGTSVAGVQANIGNERQVVELPEQCRKGAQRPDAVLWAIEGRPHLEEQERGRKDFPHANQTDPKRPKPFPSLVRRAKREKILTIPDSPANTARLQGKPEKD